MRWDLASVASCSACLKTLGSSPRNQTDLSTLPNSNVSDMASSLRPRNFIRLLLLQMSSCGLRSVHLCVPPLMIPSDERERRSLELLFLARFGTHDGHILLATGDSKLISVIVPR